MLSVDNIRSYLNWHIMFTVHTYAHNRELSAIIIKSNKPVAFFSKRKKIQNITTLHQRWKFS